MYTVGLYSKVVSILFFPLMTDASRSLREQMHKCWACDVSLSGLGQFSRHIECEEHNSKLISLKQRTERGFKVDYSNDELKDLCVQRDHNRRLIKYVYQKCIPESVPWAKNSQKHGRCLFHQDCMIGGEAGGVCGPVQKASVRALTPHRSLKTY